PRPGERRLAATVTIDGAERRVGGGRNGAIAGVVDALQRDCGIALTFLDYSEHAVGGGADALAAAYVKVRGEADETLHGVGMDGNIITASLKAVAGPPPRVRKARVH